MRFTQSWLAVGALIIALVLPGISWARTSSEERIARLEEIFEKQITIGVINKLENLQQENQWLRGALELQEHEIKQLSMRLDKLDVNSEQRVDLVNVITPNKDTQASIEENLSKIEEIKANNPSNEINTNAESSSYKNAYDLIDKENYSPAETAFKDFLWQYPDSKYAANTHYWLGEIYFAQWQKNTEKQLLAEQAITSFKVVIDKYPQHHKAVDAMLKLGMLEAERGNWPAAKEYFENLKLKFPESSKVSIGDAKLQELKQLGHI
jgi:tol-pal system protein YbgF